MSARAARPTSSCCEEYEAERPGRAAARGRRATIVGVLCAGLSLFAVFWVLHPIAAERYRSIFLAVVLLLTFLVFRARGNRPGRARARRTRPPLDWALGLLALVAVGYAARRRRRAVPARRGPRDARRRVRRASPCALILEATRRTVGWILPAICIGFLAYAYLGGLLPDWTGHRAQGLRARPARRPVVHGPGGHLRRPARRRRDLHRAVHALRRGARVLRRRALLRRAVARGVRLEPHRPGPDDDAGRLPARHRVGLGRGDDGDARLGHVAAAAQGRATRRTRAAACWPPRASARSSRRRRSARRRSSSPSSWRRATSTCSSTRRCRRSCTTSACCWRSRPTRAASRSAGLELETPGFWSLLGRFGYHFLSLFAIVALLARRLLAVPRRALRDRAGVPALVPRPARPDDAGARCGRRSWTARAACCRSRPRARRRA